MSVTVQGFAEPIPRDKVPSVSEWRKGILVSFPRFSFLFLLVGGFSTWRLYRSGFLALGLMLFKYRCRSYSNSIVWTSFLAVGSRFASSLLVL